jgi:hypothetical protein
MDIGRIEAIELTRKWYLGSCIAATNSCDRLILGVRHPKLTRVTQASCCHGSYAPKSLAFYVLSFNIYKTGESRDRTWNFKASPSK